jgi:hypothetical protein
MCRWTLPNRSKPLDAQTASAAFEAVEAALKNDNVNVRLAGAASIYGFIGRSDSAELLKRSLGTLNDLLNDPDARFSYAGVLGLANLKAGSAAADSTAVFEVCAADRLSEYGYTGGRYFGVARSRPGQSGGAGGHRTVRFADSRTTDPNYAARLYWTCTSPQRSTRSDRDRFHGGPRRSGERAGRLQPHAPRTRVDCEGCSRSSTHDGGRFGSPRSSGRG